MMKIEERRGWGPGTASDRWELVLGKAWCPRIGVSEHSDGKTLVTLIEWLSGDKVGSGVRPQQRDLGQVP